VIEYIFSHFEKRWRRRDDNVMTMTLTIRLSVQFQIYFMCMVYACPSFIKRGLNYFLSYNHYSLA